MKNEELIQTANRSLLANYRQAPMVLVEGKGCRVKDADGKSYLDLCAGIAVVSVGHGHPRLARALYEQAGRLIHTSNLFFNQRSIELAAELARRTGFSRFYFCNSGAEANESLFKLARRYHFDRGEPARIEVVTALSSFHGRTMGALSMTGQVKYHDGMGPLVPGVRHVPYNDIAALEHAIDERTAAVVLEPVQGEGGVVVGTDEYLRAARKLCDARGALLMFDEVQTCMGRTGRFMGREHSGVMPDACALAKGIASGFPLGAMAVTEALAHALPPGTHASTFGGNPLACAAALEVLSILDDEELVDNADRVGAYLGEKLEQLAQLPAVAQARGRGLLRGVKLAPHLNPASVLSSVREQGVLLSLAGGDVLRFTPPLCVTREEIDEGVAVVERVLMAQAQAGAEARV
jgi:predicted acetylornithine/succinylornithine family transaminase